MKRTLLIAVLAILAFPATAQASLTSYLFNPRYITEASPHPSSLFGTEVVKGKQAYLGSPSLRGVYVKASRSSSDAFPSSWYLRDASGNKVKDKKFGYYIMYPRSGWAQHVASDCARTTSAKQASVCYLDGMGPMSLDRASARLIDPRTRKPYTTANWLRDAGFEAKVVEDAFTTFHVVVNSVGNGSYFFSRAAPTSRLATGWGVSAEQFGPSKPGLEIRMIRSTHAWVICKNNSAIKRRKALAVFLLAAGAGDRFDSYSWTDGAGTWYAEYNKNLGRPNGKLVTVTRHVWKRSFSNGAVLYNASTHTVQIKAGGHSYRLLPKKQRIIEFS